MAKKTPTSAKPTKATKPKQGASLGEQDIRRVVEMVMAEFVERARSTPWPPPLNRGDHVIRQDEARWLLDYIINMATSLRIAIEDVPRSKGWTYGC